MHDTRHHLWLLAVLAILAFPSVSSSGDPPPSDLAELGRIIGRIASSPPGSVVAGVAVLDVRSGAEIYVRNADQPLNPASNAKIVTASAALKRLGPEFRFATSIHGKLEGNVVRGHLYLKGHADPTLSSTDLWEMARELKAAGVRRIEGGVVVDDTYFDDRNLPFAFDQQPDEDNKFRSPVGAVSLNHNALAITVRPGPAVMAKAQVLADPPGYAELANDTVTMAGGANSPKISATTFENRTKLRVWGEVPLGAASVTYYRRIDNPSLFSGHGLKGVLEESGITVGGGVQVGPLPPGTPLLAEHLSPPLSVVLLETGKLSNNFVTETVLKTMGAEAGKGPGTWEAGVAAVAETLAAWGMPKGSYTYRNGSGLYDADRFSARGLAGVLRGVYLDASVQPEFLSQLAVGGVDGTIDSRYAGPSTKRYVRAKTGTLDDVAALSGYVLDRKGERPVVFSILVNKASGYVSSARGWQEKIVTAIADALNP
ncbi:MAG: D-alanyl-D-alanine carboxypeptidase/D-alanyl-D-alanine-endopeptidase [Deltaproteobacteria bacterium]|nr:D-alanyl-D-alanine carboxypeptidase/D-alanyl-D-alanine-endopeptidase [Deltaproteobacteria bacterium]